METGSDVGGVGEPPPAVGDRPNQKVNGGVRFESTVDPPHQNSESNLPEGTTGRSGRRSRSRGRSRSSLREPAGTVATPANAATTSSGNDQRSWAAVARVAEKGYGLSYYQPTIVDEEPVVQIPAEVMREANPKWGQCLVGYYVGRKIPYKVTADALRSALGDKLVELLLNDDGFYFLHIPDESFRAQLLEGGPLTVARVPMMLQQWHPRLELKRESFEVLPVWVRLKSIPYVFWSPTGVSYVASALGKPLHVDLQTEKLNRISYARACVAICANRPLRNKVKVESDGLSWTVEVEYEGRLPICPGCRRFGHKCPPKPADQVEPSLASPVMEPSPVDRGSQETADAPTDRSSPKVMQANDAEWTTVRRRRGKGKGKNPPPPAAVVLSLRNTDGDAGPSEIQNPLFVTDGGASSSPDGSSSPADDEKEGEDTSSDDIESISPSPEPIQGKEVLNASTVARRRLGPSLLSLGRGISQVKTRPPPRRPGPRKR